jgi:hypothetical protein
VQLANPLGIDPRSVISPKGSVANVQVLHDGRAFPDGDPRAWWSCARLEWDGRPAIGLRWDGGDGQPSGMPQSRGIPIWFIVPDPLAALVEQAVTGAAVKSLRQCVNDLVHAARRASPEELSQL